MKTTIKSYDMKAKISLSRFGLLDHILCEWRLVRQYFECKLFWVGGGGWDIILGGWSYVEVYGTLFWVAGGEWGCVMHYVFGKIFWVGGGGWENILD